MKKRPPNLQTLLKMPTTQYELFHSKTAISITKKHRIAVKKVYFKAYDRFNAFKLPQTALSQPLKQLLTKRRSGRKIDPKSQLRSGALGTLLYYSAGMKKYVDPFESYRFYPSAGGRFPLEVYLIANRVEGLTPGGVYHYNVRGDYLEERLPTRDESISSCFQQPFVKRSNAILVVTSIFKRTTIKYGERGYRYVLMECGHMGQNIYLMGSALGLQVCGICGFYDDALNNYLHIDGVSEAPLYCFTLN